MKVSKRKNDKYGFDYDKMADVISKNLVKLRYKFGYTFDYLAKEIGTGTSNILSWEQGVVLPSLKNLYILSKIYDVSMDELCTKNIK